jgi:hypothetical protein
MSSSFKLRGSPAQAEGLGGAALSVSGPRSTLPSVSSLPPRTRRGGIESMPWAGDRINVFNWMIPPRSWVKMVNLQWSPLDPTILKQSSKTARLGLVIGSTCLTG